MDNFRITTTLNLAPTPLNCSTYTTIIRGASAELIFDFNQYSYLLASDSVENWDQYIDQMTFLFKWDKKPPVAYQLRDKNGYIDTKHFSYDPELKYLSFIFSSKETAEMDLASYDAPVQYEVAIKANTEALIGQSADSVVIEKQSPIVIVDSLYRESGLYK